MSIPYALRYTLIDEAADASVLQWINVKSPGHLVIMHSADEDVNRDHWHALIWSDKKEQALRSDFKKANPGIVGQGKYSLTPITKKNRDNPVEVYERYMCHGKHEGDPVIVVSAFGTKYISSWFTEQNKAYYAERKVMKSKEAKKANSQNTVNNLLKECEQSCTHDREGIALKFVLMYKKERKPINTFYARHVVNTVQAILVGKDADKELACEIAGRF